MDSINIPGVSSEDLSLLTDVVVVNCGGTINMSVLPGRGPAGVVERKIRELQLEMSGLGIGVRNVEIFSRPPDSSNIGEIEWQAIIDCIASVNEGKRATDELIARKGAQVERGGIVVAHGTDTLQITALIVALEFSLRPLIVPIIFTASHSPIEAAGSDGLSNIRKAIYIAKERFLPRTALVPAVYVLIGQDIHLASRLTKVRTMPDSDGRYFFSFPAPVGRVTGKQFHIRIDESYIRRMLPESPAMRPSDLGRRLFGIVEHIVMDKFSRSVVLDDFRRRTGFYISDKHLGERGVALVIQGDFSANREFSTIVEKLRLIDLRIPIFVGSKKSHDRLASADFKVFLLPKSLTHAKAQAKLRWLLSFSGLYGVDKLLGTNFAGEIFDAPELPEWINYETFPDNKVGAEIVVAYPNLHWKVADDAVCRVQKDKPVGGTLFIYGFGDGHIPTVNFPIPFIVKNYIDREYLSTISLSNEAALGEVFDSVAAYLREYEPRGLENYLARKYKIDSQALRSALFREIVRDVEARERQHLREAVKNLIENIPKGSVEVHLRNPDQALKSIMQQIKISFAGEEIGVYINSLKLANWNAELVRLLQGDFCKLLALRVIKDAIMASDKLLDVIGRAVDSRINVRVRSLAVKSRSNTTNYETGNLLMILGAHSDDESGWNTLYFVPRGE